MRLKYVPEARELISSHPNLIIDKQDDEIIDLIKLFQNNNLIHIEIGMGKGQFVYELAKENPTINYIGIEKFDSAIVRALEKVIENPLDNLILLRVDAEKLATILGQKKIDRIYLNFSDPWPKVRHAKRRLTHHNFLHMYQFILRDNATIEFKTDNEDLFDFTIEEMTDFPMNILFSTRNLHQENVENIMTEFEEKFSNEGKNIYKVIAQFKEEV